MPLFREFATQLNELKEAIKYHQDASFKLSVGVYTTETIMDATDKLLEKAESLVAKLEELSEAEYYGE